MVQSVFAESGDAMNGSGVCPTNVEVIVAAALAAACGSCIVRSSSPIVVY